MPNFDDFDPVTAAYLKTASAICDVLFKPPEEPEKLVCCDCCGKMKPADEVHRVWAYGIETDACDDCMGDGDRELGGA